MKTATRIALLVLLSAGSVVAEDEPPPPFAQEFFAAYCVRCHNGDKTSGGQDFEALPFELRSAADIDRWQTIVDVLNLGEMPPEVARKRPTAEEVQRLVDWGTTQIESAHRLLAADQVTRFRRLNNFEYQRTIRDLLGLELYNYDPTHSPGRFALPSSEREQGFDNLAGTLVMSDYLLDNYLDAAESIIERATLFAPRPEPVRIEHSFAVTEADGIPLPPAPFRHLFEGVGREDSSFVGIPWFRDHPLPAGGRYRVTIRVSGHNRHDNLFYQPYPHHEMLRLAVYVSPHAAVDQGYPGVRDAKMAEFEVPADGEIHEYSCEIYIAGDSAPRFAWQNGAELKILSLARNVHGGMDELALEEQRLGRKPSSHEAAMLINRLVFTDLCTPHLRLYDGTVEGPLEPPRWPPRGHELLYGTASREEIERFGAEDFRRLLEGVCTQAFRRPAQATEVDAYLAFLGERIAGGSPPLEALQRTYQAVLCSTDFLYQRIPPGPLGDVELASRLSYFLWSSMPDADLMADALEGKLRAPATLRAHAERLLDAPRSRAFAEHFPECWLHLYKLGEMPPDPAKFKAYYREDLEAAMRQETLLYFDDVLRRNASVFELLDSHHTFVNIGLARLYGIEGVSSAFFQRVDLPDRRRGGLLGQASILTVTANGVDTSPILRGVWVLRNLLGQPPPQPPPGIEPIPPDLRGVRTVKEQLEIHRDSQTCNRCHRSIDPLGIALETFDAIGAVRTHYDERALVDQNNEVTEVSRQPVDASYRMADGTPFQDIVEFKQLLLREKPAFARCLAEKLLTYALGRELTWNDRSSVDAIVGELGERGFGLRDLVLLVVASDAFAGR